MSDAAATPARAAILAKHAFKPGQSGNPNGRRNIPLSIARLAREHTEECVETLLKIMRRSRSEEMRKSCAVELMTRGWGKPAQVLGIIGGADPGFGGKPDGSGSPVIGMVQKIEVVTALLEAGEAGVIELPSAQQDEAERMLA